MLKGAPQAHIPQYTAFPQWVIIADFGSKLMMMLHAYIDPVLIVRDSVAATLGRFHRVQT